MKILCIIDNLGSGGAQRQIVYLAKLLMNQAHEVSLITYNNGDFFEPLIANTEIKRIHLDTVAKWQRPLALSKAFRREKPDAVIAFMEMPSLFSELASFYKKRWILVVSERNTDPTIEFSFRSKIFRQMHSIADVITTNSHTNRKAIEASNKKLQYKTVTIYNAVDLETFHPRRAALKENKPLRLVALSSHKPAKNFIGLAKAVAMLKEAIVPEFSIDWYGGEAPGWLAIDSRIRQEYSLEELIHFYPATADAASVLDQADALIHPSRWEGLPNAVCESLATGCPVLASNVCDARNLVKPGETGFLFDPDSPEDIAESIKRFLLLTVEERSAMRNKCRVFAEHLFSPERFVRRYEQLLYGIMADPETGLRHWPPDSN